MSAIKSTIAASVLVVSAIAIWKFLPASDGPAVRPLQPSASISTFASVTDGRNTLAAPADIGQDPWINSEKHQSVARDKARKSAIAAVSGAWSNFCKGTNGKSTLEGLGYYLEQRGNQERGYATTWGEPGRSFIEKAFTTADDQRIERMMRQIYNAGYFKLDDMRGRQREMAVKLLGDEKPGKNACPSAT